MQTPRKCEEMTGEFRYERNAFANDGEDNRTIIGDLTDGTTIKGRARLGALEPGLTYRFYGYWVTHPKYGRQFSFQSFTLATPTGERGTVAYLQRANGIGRKRAMEIWDAYGESSLFILRTSPNQVAEEIDGLTVEQCKAASEYFEELAGTEAVTIELTDLFANRGFPRSLVEAVLRKWGNAAPSVIRDEPYVLMRFKGVGFLRADALYLELGHPADAIDRQGWCIWHALNSDQEGNTWLSLKQCTGHLNANIAGGEVKVDAAVQWATNQALVTKRVEDGEIWLAEYGRAKAEDGIAGCIHQAELGG